jgi:hypothetical protein
MYIDSFLIYTISAITVIKMMIEKNTGGIYNVG